MEVNASSRWILGFSGGKDSTALLKIFNSALGRTEGRPKLIDLIYCDTGVENPILDRYVQILFGRLQQEFSATDSPFRCTILQAPIEDRFFVKIIGRGYPPPTNNFRWCTKNLRIRPVAKFISEACAADAIVSLGMRRNESVQRDRSIAQNGVDFWQTQREGSRKYRLFLPILDLNVSEVWDAVFMLPLPRSIQALQLEQIYRDASGECPVIKAPSAQPCASGRFGCWTCTVVRKDRSSAKLIEAGYAELLPYFEFRNWLSRIRNEPTWRWRHRRSGATGMGPFTLAARHRILAKLRELEVKCGRKIISSEEADEIARLWELDTPLEQAADTLVDDNNRGIEAASAIAHADVASS